MGARHGEVRLSCQKEGNRLSVAESAVAVWIFALLAMLVFAGAQAQALLTLRAANHEAASFLAEGTLMRDGRLLARGEHPPLSSFMEVGEETFAITSQVVTAATYLRQITVSVQTIGGPNAYVISVSTLQAVGVK